MKATDTVQMKRTRQPLAVRLGTKIATLRKERGWTQAALAELVGVDTETISRFERGVTLPSLVTLEVISDSLRVGVGELLSESSALPSDQAAMLNAWLAPLDASNRAFVVDLVQRTCEHLRGDR